MAGDEATAVTAALLNQPADSTPRILVGAGDWGTMMFNAEGELLLHHPVGHVQSLTIANLRSDLPGLEMVSSNFWGSQGIIYLYDASGHIYSSFEPGSHGSMCQPVNWRGDGVAYFLLNASPGDGGLFDGRGLLVVAFPDDDHPELCNAVLDVYGDSRDEILTWNQRELWVYTQSDNPRKGRVYHPERNPLYNYSNYRVNISTMRRNN
jgi:rhamnogalacturonan endolyase